MTAEQTAIRHPRGLWHREDPRGGLVCKAYTARRVSERLTDRLPLSQTDPADRCGTCWPTTEDTK